jgi:hypothetical protein
MAANAVLDFAKSDGGKFIIGGAKSAGRALGNTIPGQAASYGLRSINAKASSILSGMSSAQSRLKAMGLDPHESKGHENSALHHESIVTRVEVGADIGKKNLKESIGNLAGADLKYMDYKKIKEEKARAVQPIMEAFASDTTAKDALAMMAGLTRGEMRNIHAEISAQLNNPNSKFSKEQKQAIQGNLNNLQKGIDSGTIRGSIKNMQEYGSSVIQDTFGQGLKQAKTSDIAKSRAAGGDPQRPEPSAPPEPGNEPSAPPEPAKDNDPQVQANNSYGRAMNAQRNEEAAKRIAEREAERAAQEKAKQEEEEKRRKAAEAAARQQDPT